MDPDVTLSGNIGLESLWPQVTAQATHIDVAPCDSITHRCQHGLRLQHRPWTAKWPLVVAQAMDISIDLAAPLLI